MIRAAGEASLEADHATLGRYRLDADPVDGSAPDLLFTENETNAGAPLRLAELARPT